MNPIRIFVAAASVAALLTGAGSTPQVATRGIQMQQSLPKTVHGLNIDEDITQDDAMGDGVLWLTRAAVA